MDGVAGRNLCLRNLLRRLALAHHAREMRLGFPGRVLPVRRAKTRRQAVTVSKARAEEGVARAGVSKAGRAERRARAAVAVGAASRTGRSVVKSAATSASAAMR